MSNFLSAVWDITLYKGMEIFNRNTWPEFFNSIAQITVSVKAGTIISFDIRVTPTYSDAIKILQSGRLGIYPGGNENTTTSSSKDGTQMSNRMDSFTKIEFNLLRPSDNVKSKTYKGFLGQPDVSISNNDIEIMLKGYGYQLLSSIETKTYVIEQFTLEDVIDLALEDISYTYSIYLAHTASVNMKLLKEVPDHSVACTPFQLLKWAMKQANLDFVEDGEDEKSIVIYDRDISDFKKSLTKYTFVQWRQVNPDLFIYPMFSYNLDSGRSLFLSGRAFGNYQMGINEKLKTALDDSGRDTSIAEQSSATSTIPDSKSNPGLRTQSYTQASNSQAKIGDTEVKKGLSTFQKITLEVPGIPDIAPLDKVKVMLGDIKELSGMVLINSVTHNINNAGWTTSLAGVIVGSIDGDIEV